MGSLNVLWIGVARWLELLPYWVGGAGVLLVLLGSGAHRPLWRLLRPEGGGGKPKAPPRPSLGIREAGGAAAVRSAPAPFEESPELVTPPRPVPVVREPSVPETVDPEQAEQFKLLQERLAKAREQRGEGGDVEPGEPVDEEHEEHEEPGSGVDLQTQIMRVAKERVQEERTLRQRRKVKRELELERTRIIEAQAAQDEAQLAREQAWREAQEQEQEQEQELQAAKAAQTSSGAAGLGDARSLAARIEALRAALERDDPMAREASEGELRGLLATLQTSVRALELLRHAAPYLGPESPLDPEQELELEQALERLRGDD